MVGFGSACEDAADRFVEWTDSVGVEIVHNTRPDRVLDWGFVERVGMGGDLGAGQLRLSRGQVGADSAGRLYVLDRAAARIVVFDSTAALVATFGRRGTGPGELDSPISISVQSDGAVSIFDIGRAVVVEFAADGTVRREWSVPSDGWEPRVAVTPDGMVGIQRSAADSGEYDRRLVIVTARDTTELAMSRRRWVTFTVPDCGLQVRAQPLFLPRLAWDVRDEVVAVNAEVGYVVTWFVAGRPSKSVRRVASARPVTEEMAYREVGDGIGVTTPNGGCRSDPIAEASARGYAAELPAVHRIRLVPDGTMWVVRGRVTGEDPTIDVFGRSGAYVGTLPVGSPVPVAFTPAGDVVAVESDAAKPARLVVYRIVRDR